MRAAVVIAVAAAMLAGVSARTLWHQLDNYSFEDYQVEFKKAYAAEELEHRRGVFNANLAKIRAHNARTDATWKEGVNPFTDRTPEEFAVRLGYAKANGYQRRGDGVVDPAVYLGAKEAAAALPTSVDWRLKGALTPIKDQGDCGSCWTFASSEELESMYFLKHGLLVEFSEQQIASCTPNSKHCGGVGGCGGGTAEEAYIGLIANGGLTTEFIYPYISHSGNDYDCILNPNFTRVAPISGYTVLPSNQALPLLTALVNSPVAITVQANTWQNYESGVFNGCNQTDPDLDHNVQAVGYGTDPTLGDYWIVRNSWTANWGEEGFIRLHRGDPSNPVCGNDTSPSDGSGCDGGPPSVVVCGTCGILYDNVIPTPL